MTDRCFSLRWHWLATLLAVLQLCACNELLARQEPRPAGALQVFEQSEALPTAPVRQSTGQRSTTGQEPRSYISPGTDRALGPARGNSRSIQNAINVGTDGAIELNLVGASIPDAAQAVLGNALRLNYSIDSELPGEITLQSSSPLGREALLEAFQAALEFNGATMFFDQGRVSILPLSQAPPQFVTPSDTRTLGRRIVVIPLTFISTREMVRLLEPIVSQDAVLLSSETRNVLMVSGREAELNAIIDAVNLFDVDVLRGKSVALIKLRAARPADVSRELTQIFESQEGGSLEGVIEFVPNERLGSILIITSRKRYLRDAERWIIRLDATAGRSKRHAIVYSLQNRSADELAPILSELLSVQSDQLQNDGTEANETATSSGGTRVVADETANSVIAWATNAEHEAVVALLQRLDATPPQVLLEATIAEVSLNDELDFGVRWFFESGNFSLRFSDLALGAVAPSFPGFSFLFDGGNARVALNALSSVTDVNVVSSPSLLVLDNREAELRVGDQVPIATQSSVDTTDPNAPIVNSIEFRDTGVILKIRPHVSDEGRVIMDIEQEVSDVVQTTSSGIDSPTISQRRIKTSVAVDSGQTLALGGLIQDSTSLVQTKVPLLGDIPLLGEFFRNKEDDIGRSELLILITPRVIRDPNEARRITGEFREALAGPGALLSGENRTPRHTLARILR